jgi:hypothetical protein
MTTGRQGNPFAVLRDSLDRQIAARQEADERAREHYLPGEPPADPVERVRYREFVAEERRAAERERAFGAGREAEREAGS